MWCRLITGDDTAVTQTISWQRAGAAAAIPGASQTARLYNANPSDSTHQYHDQIVADAYRNGLKDG